MHIYSNGFRYTRPPTPPLTTTTTAPRRSWSIIQDKCKTLTLTDASRPMLEVCVSEAKQRESSGVPIARAVRAQAEGVGRALGGQTFDTVVRLQSCKGKWKKRKKTAKKKKGQGRTWERGKEKVRGENSVAFSACLVGTRVFLWYFLQNLRQPSSQPAAHPLGGRWTRLACARWRTRWRRSGRCSARARRAGRFCSSSTAGRAGGGSTRSSTPT